MAVLDPRTVLSITSDLATLPESATRISSILSNEDWDLDDVVLVVRRDPVLAARVLQVANAAGLVARAEISDLSVGVLRLGVGAILALVIGSSVRREMTRSSSGFDEARLWRHSVATALTVESMPSAGGRQPPTEAYSAAILHDIGMYLVARYLRDHPPEGAVESETIDSMHAEVGALAAEQWNLSPVLCGAIRHHHDPVSGPDEEVRRVAACIALGDGVATRIGMPHGGASVELDLFGPEMVEATGIDEAAFEALCETVAGRLDAFAHRYD